MTGKIPHGSAVRTSSVLCLTGRDMSKNYIERRISPFVPTLLTHLEKRLSKKVKRPFWPVRPPVSLKFTL